MPLNSSVQRTIQIINGARHRNSGHGLPVSILDVERQFKLKGIGSA